MRLYTRLFITRTNLGLDDALCFLSYCFTVTFSGIMLKCFTLGIGRHMWDVEAKSLANTFKLFTISQYIYILLTLFIKLTLLVFYYRLFSVPSARYKYVLHTMVALVIALNVGIFFATVFNCTPRAHAWDPSVPGTCSKTGVLPWFSGASSSLTDIIVLLIPVPILWRMNMAFNKKVRVMAVFGIGLFACIASLIRLGMTQVLYSSTDRTWNISTISIWATLEVNIGIICSCLMFLPAFLDRYFPYSARVPLSGLWNYTLNTMGVGSKKSSSSLGSKYGARNAAWPAHDEASSESEAAKHHTSVETKPSGSQQSIQMHSAAATVVEGNAASITSVPSHSFAFGFGDSGGIYDGRPVTEKSGV
ncbi:hypothetical protein B0T19DRAFT_455435 [Cercophora scortea]|uniref:Rhodopsin domain-containing protein n=1 Tax=Cercophora scortea TaxID=314031 RepID=A0AAE0MM14_9PEZI|nr:hypothetical protein B0T19DRAFT_455435 [Cercophora scortea]